MSGTALRAARLPVSPMIALGALLVLGWVAVAVLAPALAPFPPNRSLQPMALPGTAGAAGTFWLGTDHLGRDILSRVVWGARTVLLYVPLATALAFALGVGAGLVAGYRRGWVDEALSRAADLVLAFPALVIFIVVISRFGASALNIVLAVTLGAFPAVMRLTRGLVAQQRGRAYVAAAVLRGEAGWRIMAVEILPNIAAPLVVDACLRLGYVTITIGTLGFLGLGLPPPDPDWGGMINEARQYALVFPHMAVAPCVAVATLVLGFNLLADGLRERLGDG